MNTTQDPLGSAVAELSPTCMERVFSLNDAPSAQLPASAWQISALLQTSLDVERVIDLFAHELGRHIPIDSFMYQHAGRDLSYSLGGTAAHSLSYRLLLEETQLGEICVTRAQRFSDSEVTGIENLISGLMYALRNALLYQEALDSALRDPLTGVFNRAAFDVTLRREVGLSQRHKLPLSVLVLDIDKFKLINDTCGHAVGDQVLCRFTQAVASCVRSTDVLARFGGDEYVVILPGTDQAGAALLAARIRSQVESLSCSAGPAGCRPLHFTTSIGVAAYDGEEDSSGLLERADQAMYSAKQRGGNRVGLA